MSKARGGGVWGGVSWAGITAIFGRARCTESQNRPTRTLVALSRSSYALSRPLRARSLRGLPWLEQRQPNISLSAQIASARRDLKSGAGNSAP